MTLTCEISGEMDGDPGPHCGSHHSPPIVSGSANEHFGDLAYCTGLSINNVILNTNFYFPTIL